MQKISFPLFITIGLILLLGSCAKEGPTGPYGPAGPGYVGSISGHVSLYDQYGNTILSNLDSVKMELNSNPSNTVVFTADTLVSPDIYGSYIYNTISTGQYYFTAADTGYGATNTNYFDFVSGSLNEDIKLSAIPAFSLAFTSYYDTVLHNDSLVISCTPNEQLRSCAIFVFTAVPSLTVLPGVGYTLSYVKNIPANASQLTAIINGQELYDAGFQTGSKIYYEVYSHAYGDKSAYEDLTTGKTIFTAISNPTIDSTLVP